MNHAIFLMIITNIVRILDIRQYQNYYQMHSKSGDIKNWKHREGYVTELKVEDTSSVKMCICDSPTEFTCVIQTDCLFHCVLGS